MGRRSERKRGPRRRDSRAGLVTNSFELLDRAYVAATIPEEKRGPQWELEVDLLRRSARAEGDTVGFGLD